MCFILEEENAMFTGDNILGHGTSAVEELSIYMNTLRKMQAQNCSIGYPAHGIMIDNLPAKIAGELAQKLRREKQVMQTLTKIKRQEVSMGRRRIGSVTIQELVTAVYGEKMNEQLKEKALEPFMDEVLRKLAEDGRVAFEMRGGVKKWFSVEA
jgi:glyoxylase-like metal-dependent hydrolase (beta-lactamase superfamily II)